MRRVNAQHILDARATTPASFFLGTGIQGHFRSFLRKAVHHVLRTAVIDEHPIPTEILPGPVHRRVSYQLPYREFCLLFTVFLQGPAHTYESVRRRSRNEARSPSVAPLYCWREPALASALAVTQGVLGGGRPGGVCFRSGMRRTPRIALDGYGLNVPALTAMRACVLGGAVPEGSFVALALALNLPRLLLAQRKSAHGDASAEPGIQQSGTGAARVGMAIHSLCAAVGGAIVNDAYGMTAGPDVDSAHVILASVAGAGVLYPVHAMWCLVLAYGALRKHPRDYSYA
ncbi:hypothetical protein ACG7TL_006703 [Trametes sanguinea]